MILTQEEEEKKMIIYTKNSFGVNLIFRVHGSAVYRAVIPAMIAVGFYFFFEQVWYREPREEVVRDCPVSVCVAFSFCYLDLFVCILVVELSFPDYFLLPLLFC